MSRLEDVFQGLVSCAGGWQSLSTDLAALLPRRGLDPLPLKLLSTAAARDTAATPLPPLPSLSSTGTVVAAGVVHAFEFFVEDPEVVVVTENPDFEVVAKDILCHTSALSLAGADFWSNVLLPVFFFNLAVSSTITSLGWYLSGPVVSQIPQGCRQGISTCKALLPV